MSKGLWLVRHGETDWSAAGRLNGWTDVALNATGRAQAGALRSRLAADQFVGAWSSDLRRAEETARLAGVQPVTDARLRELDFGDLEGLTWSELSTADQLGMVAFDGFAAPNGEPVAALRARALEFLEMLPDGDHLIVTHGGVIRTLLRLARVDGRVGPGDLRRLRSAPADSSGTAWIVEVPLPDDVALP